MDRVVPSVRKVDAVILTLTVLLLTFTLAATGSSGREQAKAAVCRANLRQLGSAQALFLNDNDDRYPSPWGWLLRSEAPVAGYQRFCRWHDPRYPPDGPVWSYLANEKVALCPTFARLGTALGAVHPSHDASIPVDPQYGYSMNSFLGSMTAYGVMRSAEITRSRAEVFVFAEENIWPRPGCTSVLNDTALCADGRDWFGTFHGASSEALNSGTINAVFADGHVQKVRSGLVTNEDGQMDRTDAEYGRFEKYAWPLDNPPK